MSRTPQVQLLDIEGSESVLAQPPPADGGFTPPTFDWDPSPQIQGICSQLAFVLIIVWLAYLLSQFVIPSRRNARGMSGKVSASQIIGLAVAVILLLNLSLIPTLVNFILTLFWGIASLFNLV